MIGVCCDDQNHLCRFLQSGAISRLAKDCHGKIKDVGSSQIRKAAKLIDAGGTLGLSSGTVGRKSSKSHAVPNLSASVDKAEPKQHRVVIAKEGTLHDEKIAVLTRKRNLCEEALVANPDSETFKKRLAECNEKLFLALEEQEEEIEKLLKRSRNEAGREIGPDFSLLSNLR